ncbi:16S rRNA (guanine(966)-N(2))-methyltransferase RsmD [Pseudoflavonifractor phocaeensis]|uniref:16S rRNA (guanine(966)-N(2))-methyltransferase RsmD n=1 Tax=Pseudoflavonifractor phocaeensis TaxID=1870988 RepID=UPI00195D192C|nr:16S rRNA (guanine(966)-N(2))-methyltransferase RsmD [Pseudoflavonifractor phocaeensis]MBM6938601.1 16S rRNA (guanine(966)-N(2))-methyltransferase RsmD [Pseudoflavonifractor phocaeensis]
MRVITGSARGKRLRELEGLETRPTTDRVKESIFNIVQFDVEGRKVLDLFGGTGQLGIEALSRGAERCTFVDMRRDAVNVIRENLKATRLAERAQVFQGDAMAWLRSCREKFDLVFLDPPYASGLLQQALETGCDIDILTENGIIVCESAVDTPLPELRAPYVKGREYRYGKIKITLYRREL